MLPDLGMHLVHLMSSVPYHGRDGHVFSQGLHVFLCRVHWTCAPVDATCKDSWSKMGAVAAVTKQLHFAQWLQARTMRLNNEPPSRTWLHAIVRVGETSEVIDVLGDAVHRSVGRRRCNRARPSTVRHERPYAAGVGGCQVTAHSIVQNVVWSTLWRSSLRLQITWYQTTPDVPRRILPDVKRPKRADGR